MLSMKAIDLLPAKSTYSGSNIGRASKDAALTQLAKAYLVLAPKDNSYYQKVTDLCDQVASLGYDLSKYDYSSNFGIKAKSSKEAIFQVGYSGSTQYNFWDSESQSSWLSTFMLGKEYFPNANLKMDAGLQTKIVKYYDFITAYQNLLRDGTSFSDESAIDVSCLNGKMALANWPPSSGNVCVLATQKDNVQILHLINLAKADLLSWRDRNATMPEPALLEFPSLKFKTLKKVSAVWMASPDIDGGVPKRIAFNQSASSVTFTLPSLKYWDMVIIEYQ